MISEFLEKTFVAFMHKKDEYYIDYDTVNFGNTVFLTFGIINPNRSFFRFIQENIEKTKTIGKELSSRKEKIKA